MKFKLKINKEICKGCRLCIIFCPKGIIKESKLLNKKGIHFVEVKKQPLCTGCLSCAIMCPECAIEITAEE